MWYVYQWDSYSPERKKSTYLDPFGIQRWPKTQTINRSQWRRDMSGMKVWMIFVAFTILQRPHCASSTIPLRLFHVLKKIFLRPHYDYHFVTRPYHAYSTIITRFYHDHSTISLTHSPFPFSILFWRIWSE